jgi:hypothetical protein
MIITRCGVSRTTGLAALTIIAALLSACNASPPAVLCIQGMVSKQSAKGLAAALQPRHERIIALELSVDRSGVWDCADTAEPCFDVDVPDPSRSSPANLAIRFIQTQPAIEPLGASGIYLSRYREHTDWTHYIELTELTNGFPTRIDRSACVHLSSASR